MDLATTYNVGLWPLLAYALIVLALMAGILALAWFSGERHQAPAANEPFESGIVGVGDARLRLSARFYLIAMFFVIFDVEALFLYAWAIVVREAGWAGYAEALLFIGVLLIALAYLWRTGALDWRSERRPAAKESQHAMVAQQSRA